MGDNDKIAQSAQEMRSEAAEENIELELPTLVSRMQAIRNDALAGKMPPQRKDEYLQLASMLGTDLRRITSTHLRARINRVARLMSDDTQLMRYDPLQRDAFFAKGRKEFIYTLDEALICVMKESFINLDAAHHVLQAVKCADTQDKGFDEQERIRETILPYGTPQLEEEHGFKFSLFRKTHTVTVHADGAIAKVEGSGKGLEDLVGKLKRLGFAAADVPVPRSMIYDVQALYPGSAELGKDSSSPYGRVAIVRIPLFTAATDAPDYSSTYTRIADLKTPSSIDHGLAWSPESNAEYGERFDAHIKKNIDIPTAISTSIFREHEAVMYHDSAAIGEYRKDCAALCFPDKRYTITAVSRQDKKDFCLRTRAILRQHGDDYETIERLGNELGAIYLHVVRRSPGEETLDYTYPPEDTQLGEAKA